MQQTKYFAEYSSNNDWNIRISCICERAAISAPYVYVFNHLAKLKLHIFAAVQAGNPFEKSSRTASNMQQLAV